MQLITKIKNNKQHGSSLIEVMIALFVLAIGLLGVLAMQVNAIKLNQNAYLYSQAAMLASDMLEAMRSNPTETNSYALTFTEATPDAPNCTTAGTDCSTSAIRDWNLNQWRTNVEGLLPGGMSEVAIIPPNEFIVRVRFQIDIDESGDAVMDEVELRSGF